MSQDNKQVSQKGLKVSVKITLAVGDIQNEYGKQLQKVSSQISVKGFRKRSGNLKLKEVERTRGPMIRAEVIDQMLQQSLNEVIRENEHTLASKPEVVNHNGDGQTEDVVFQLSYEVFPTVPETDLAKLTLDSVAPVVDQKDVDAEVAKLKEHHGEWKACKRASKKGDQIKIDFMGRLDGELFEGGSATDQVVELGEGRFLKDFETHLLKKKAGDEFSFEMTFPSDYGAEQLANKAVTFEVKVHEVLEKKPLALGKALYEACEIEAKTEEEFEKAIRGRLEEDAKEFAQAVNRKRLIKLLKKSIAFDLPEATVAEEMEIIQKNEEGIKEKDANAKARERIQVALIIRHFIDKYAIKATEEDIKAYIAMGAPSQMAIDGFYDWFIQDENRLNQVKSAVIEKNCLNAVLEKVSLKEKTCSISEIEKELKEEG